MAGANHIPGTLSCFRVTESRIPEREGQRRAWRQEGKGEKFRVDPLATKTLCSQEANIGPFVPTTLVPSLFLLGKNSIFPVLVPCLVFNTRPLGIMTKMAYGISGEHSKRGKLRPEIGYSRTRWRKLMEDKDYGNGSGGCLLDLSLWASDGRGLDLTASIGVSD